MPVVIGWLDDTSKTILLNTWIEDASLEDFAASVAENKQWITGVPHTVDLIVDVRGIHRTHIGNFLSLRSRMDTLLPPNQGHVVVVGANMVVQVTVGLGQKMGSRAMQQIHFTETMEAALDLLQYRDQATGGAVG